MATGAVAQQSAPSEAPERLPPIVAEPEADAEADAEAEATAEPTPLSEDQARTELLDALFERLSDPEATDWEATQTRIYVVWNVSGSDSMDLLVSRVDRAMGAEPRGRPSKNRRVNVNPVAMSTEVAWGRTISKVSRSSGRSLPFNAARIG